MEIKQNPLELLTAKVQETFADTQNLANQAVSKVQETTTVVIAWVQSALSSIASAGYFWVKEQFYFCNSN